MKDVYENPLCSRYASEQMQHLFSPQWKFSTFRRLWLALAESEQELGLSITDEQLEEMRAHLDDIDFDRAAEYEHRLRHDVMAHIRTFGDACPKAAGIIHLGATSCYVDDNTDLLQMRAALKLIRGELLAVIDALSEFAAREADTPTLAWTHFQAAQPTTVGKRATLWLQDFLLDLEQLETELSRLPISGCKGATGTAASFLALFHGDGEKVLALEKKIAEKMGVPNCIPVAGQTYTRKLDSFVMNVLSGIAQTASKMATDIILSLLINITNGIQLWPNVIRRHIQSELPFMATENLLMAAVKKGGNRQELHEVIRTHSMAAAKRVKEEGADNDLLDRLRNDPAFACIRDEFDSLLDPSTFIGRAPEQVTDFLNECIRPILGRYKAELDAASADAVNV